MPQVKTRGRRDDRQRLAIAVAVLGCLGAVGCEGSPGPAGPPGPDGPAGSSCTVTDNGDGTRTIACADGTTVTVADGMAGGSCTVTDELDGTKTITCSDGTTVTVPDGRACWDLDGNGRPDVATEDRNGDGLVNVDDCGGPGGPSGASCWDLNGDGLPDLPAEDRNGDGIVSVLDCDGASTGPLSGRVLDAHTFAGLADVTVWTSPATATTVTDASGAFTIADVPLGMYNVLARGATVDGRLAEASAGPVSVVAIGGGTVDVPLRRIPDAWLANLGAYHNPANVTLFNNATCAICHTTRAAETSLDPALPPFHAVPEHSAAGCVYCHDLTVDFRHGSAANLSRNVSIDKCTVCHSRYPVFP